MGKGAVSKKSSSSSSGAGGGSGADSKKVKCRTRQAKAGLCFSVNKIHRELTTARKGKVSTDAAVAIAAFLEFLVTSIHLEATRAADKGIASVEDGKKQPHRIVNRANVQTGIAANKWARQFLIKGTVAGSAPISNLVDEEDDDNDDNE